MRYTVKLNLNTIIENKVLTIPKFSNEQYRIVD